MGRFFSVNAGLAVPVLLIVVWLAASAVIRCSGYLFRKARQLIITMAERLLAPLERALAERTK